MCVHKRSKAEGTHLALPLASRRKFVSCACLDRSAVLQDTHCCHRSCSFRLLSRRTTAHLDCHELYCMAEKGRPDEICVSRRRRPLQISVQRLSGFYGSNTRPTRYKADQRHSRSTHIRYTHENSGKACATANYTPLHAFCETLPSRFGLR